MPEARVKTAAIRVIPVAGSAGLATGTLQSRGIVVKAGISPLGYWQKVNPSPTQTKPYNTLPPFEQRDSSSSYGAVRAYSDVLL